MTAAVAGRYLLTMIALLTLPVIARESPAALLRINGHSLFVEIAATAAARTRGLSGRTSLGADEGMLLVLPAPQPVCVWMKGTSLALAAAFLDSGGNILQLVELTPNSTEQHCSEEPAQYVLEMPSAWFNRKDILPGAIVRGLEAVPAGEL